MIDFSSNQLEAYEGVQQSIKNLLQDAVYLCGRKDAQVCTVMLSFPVTIQYSILYHVL
jgi:hypothetical protein